MAMTRQSAPDRVTHYTDKLVPARVQAVLILRKPSMVTSAATWLAHMAWMRAALHGVIGSSVFVGAEYGRYMAYSLQVDKLKRQYGGGLTLATEVALLIAKWKARECVEQTLIDIRNTLFGIGGVPAP